MDKERGNRFSAIQYVFRIERGPIFDVIDGRPIEPGRVIGISRAKRIPFVNDQKFEDGGAIATKVFFYSGRSAATAYFKPIDPNFGTRAAIRRGDKDRAREPRIQRWIIAFRDGGIGTRIPTRHIAKEVITGFVHDHKPRAALPRRGERGLRRPGIGDRIVFLHDRRDGSGGASRHIRKPI